MSDKEHANFPVSFKDWASGLRTGDSDCTNVMCYPIKLTLLLLFCLPCTCYNSGRNRCSGTEEKNYLC